MASKTLTPASAWVPQQPVAGSRWLTSRIRASVGAVLAVVGHGTTLLTLGAGTLWLGFMGGEGLATARSLFVLGLYAQVLPAAGFALMTRHFSRVGTRGSALGTGLLSFSSLALLGVGAVQSLGSAPLESALLGTAIVLATGAAIGIVGTRLGSALQQRLLDFETPRMVEDGTD